MTAIQKSRSDEAKNPDSRFQVNVLVLYKFEVLGETIYLAYAIEDIQLNNQYH